MKTKNLCLSMLVLVFLTMLVPAVMAFENGDPRPLTDLFAAFGKILPVTIVVSLATSLMGYLSSTPPEKFELDKFIATAIIGLLIGIFTLSAGWDYTTAQEYLANGGITIYVYWLCKIVAKKAGWINNK